MGASEEESERERGRERETGGEERREYKQGGGGILLFLNPNSRIHAGSRGTHEHTHMRKHSPNTKNAPRKSLHTISSFMGCRQTHFTDVEATQRNILHACTDYTIKTTQKHLHPPTNPKAASLRPLDCPLVAGESQVMNSFPTVSLRKVRSKADSERVASSFV